MTDAVTRKTVRPTLIPAFAPARTQVVAEVRREAVMQRPASVTLPDGAVVGHSDNPDIIFTNGVNLPSSVFMQCLSALAVNGARVTGVYNLTEGPIRDWIQGYADHLVPSANKAITSMATLIERAVLRGKPVVLIGHSQGAAVVALALQIVHDKLRATYTAAQVSAMMNRLCVETHAAAGCHFIDGPKYVHYINRDDPVPHFMGLARGLSLSTLHYPGKNAVFRYFSDTEPAQSHPEMDVLRRMLAKYDDTVHSMLIYAKHRLPFAKAYSAGSNVGGPAERRALWTWSLSRFAWDVLSLPLTLWYHLRQLGQNSGA